MVQILEHNEHNFLDSILGGGAKGAAAAAQSIPEVLKMKKEQQKQDLINKLIGKGTNQPNKLSPSQQLNNTGQPRQTGQQPSQSQTGEFSSANLSDADILGLSLIDPATAKTMQHARDVSTREAREETSAERKKFEADREFHSKRSDPYLQEANEIIQSAPIKKGLALQLRRDIESGATEGILPYMVEKTGLEFWRNPESARFRTAAKDRFVETLSSIAGGARPNMYLEQQLVSAQPSLGRSKLANATVLDMEDFIDDMKLQKAKYVSDLAKEDMEKYGYVKSDVADRANDKMADYAEKRQDQMAYDIRQRTEDTLKDHDLLQDVVAKNIKPGTPLTMRMAALLMIKNHDDPVKAQREAKSLGFILPKESSYQRYMQ